MAGLIFDDRVFEWIKSLIKPLISFISWGTFGATLGGIAGFAVGFLVAPDVCYFACASETSPLVGTMMIIGAVVGSILGNILATSDYSDDEVLVLFFISIPAGVFLGGLVAFLFTLLFLFIYFLVFNELP